MPSILHQIVQTDDYKNVTPILFQGNIPIFLQITQDTFTAAQAGDNEYNNALDNQKRDVVLEKDRVMGLFSVSDAIIDTDLPEVPGVVIDSAKAQSIRQIVSSVAPGTMEPPYPVYIEAYCFEVQDLQDRTAAMTAFDEQRNKRQFLIQDRFLLPGSTQKSLRAGNDLLLQVSRTMFGLTEDERAQVKSIRIEEEVMKGNGMEILAVPVIRAAISFVMLTGLNPKEWVDPKVVRIQQDAGSRAAANFIIEYLGK